MVLSRLRLFSSYLILIFLILISVNIVIENRLLNNYIKEIEHKTHVNKPYSDEEILIIRDYIIKDIDCQSPSIAICRPKIGWSVKEIILRKQGLCGEGSRLLYNILAKSKIESRRIYLHGSRCLHIILEYRNSKNKWILLETINGNSEYFKKVIDSNTYTIDSLFTFGPYRYHVSPRSLALLNGFSNYSYFPTNGIFNNGVFLSEVYIHKAPSSFVSLIFERTHLFIIFILIIILLCINIKYFSFIFSTCIIHNPKFQKKCGK
jgi:hypothetical protein